MPMKGGLMQATFGSCKKRPFGDLILIQGACTFPNGVQMEQDLSFMVGWQVSW